MSKAPTREDYVEGLAECFNKVLTEFERQRLNQGKPATVKIDISMTLDALARVVGRVVTMQPGDAAQRYVRLCRFEKRLLETFNVRDGALRGVSA